MALPITRTEFKDYCLRKLGQGAIDINVTVDQIEDRIDEALEHFNEYHDEGTERVFIKHQITQADLDNEYFSMSADVIGVTSFIPLSNNTNNNIFSADYQYMQDLAHTSKSRQMQYFYVDMMNLSMVEQMFDYHTPIQYNRISNRVHIYENWESNFHVDDYILFDGFKIIDATAYARIWSNKWLRDYATNMIKLQWGENLAKYDGLATIGGATFNASRIMEEARTDIEKLEIQLKETESAPLGIFIG